MATVRSVGLLGSDYPGYFPVGETKSCAALLRRAEDDPGFCADLRERCARVAPLFAPERAREAWRTLPAEVLAD